MIVQDLCCGSSLHSMRNLVRIRKVVSGSPSRNIFSTNCKGIYEDEGKERSWMLCASIKGLGSMCVHGAGTCEGSRVDPHRTRRRLVCWKMRMFIQCFWRTSACGFQQETEDGIEVLGKMFSDILEQVVRGDPLFQREASWGFVRGSVALLCHKLSAVELVAKIVGLFGKNSLPGMDRKLLSPPHPSPDGESLPCNPQPPHCSFIPGWYSRCRTLCVFLISRETLPFGGNIMLLLMGLKLISSFPITYFISFMNVKWCCGEKSC